MRATALSLALLLHLSGAGWASASPPTGSATPEPEAPKAVPSVSSMMLGSGYELGVEATFLQFGAGAVATAVGFPEVAQLELRGRAAWGESTDVGVALTLLPVQPRTTDLWGWQRLGLSLRHRLADAWAFELDLDAGPQIAGDLGHWGTITACVKTRRRIATYLVVEGVAGPDVLHLPFDDGSVAHIFEVRAGGEALVPLSFAVFYAGLEFAAPVFSLGEFGNGIGAPSPRLLGSLRVGASLAVSEVWVPFVQFKVVRRGDLGDPRTTVPILDEGFDQEQLTIGLTLRLPR